MQPLHDFFSVQLTINIKPNSNPNSNHVDSLINGRKKNSHLPSIENHLQEIKKIS